MNRNSKDYEKTNENEIITIADVHDKARDKSDSENLRTARD